MHYHIETREERFWGTAISRVAPPSSILALLRQLAKENWLYEKIKNRFLSNILENFVKPKNPVIKNYQDFP